MLEALKKSLVLLRLFVSLIYSYVLYTSKFHSTGRPPAFINSWFVLENGRLPMKAETASFPFVAPKGLGWLLQMQNYDNTADRAVGIVPDLIDKFADIFSKSKKEKGEQ